MCSGSSSSSLDTICEAINYRKVDESCYSDSDCYSGLCSNNKCIIKKAGESCSSTKNCDKFSTCSNNKCV